MQPVRFGTIIYVKKTQAPKGGMTSIFSKSDETRKKLDDAVDKLKQEYSSDIVHTSVISDTERLVVIGEKDIKTLMETESRVAQSAGSITAAKERMVAVRILLAEQADKVIDVDA